MKVETLRYKEKPVNYLLGNGTGERQKHGKEQEIRSFYASFYPTADKYIGIFFTELTICSLKVGRTMKQRLLYNRTVLGNLSPKSCEYRCAHNNPLKWDTLKQPGFFTLEQTFVTKIKPVCR